MPARVEPTARARRRGNMWRETLRRSRVVRGLACWGAAGGVVRGATPRGPLAPRGARGARPPARPPAASPRGGLAAAKRRQKKTTGRQPKPPPTGGQMGQEREQTTGKTPAAGARRHHPGSGVTPPPGAGRSRWPRARAAEQSRAEVCAAGVRSWRGHGARARARACGPSPGPPPPACPNNRGLCMCARRGHRPPAGSSS